MNQLFVYENKRKENDFITEAVFDDEVQGDTTFANTAGPRD